MNRMKTWIGIALLGSSLAAHAQPGKPVSPYSQPLAQRPIAATALMQMQVTDKKKTYVRGFLDHTQYTDIRSGALEIMKRYPPKKYFYVTLGRSPTPIAAFLDNLSEKEGELHVNIPASNLRNGQTDGFEQVWTEHLDRFIPKHVLEGKQRIVLIDRSTTGATLVKVKGILDNYLEQKGIKKAVKVLAFARAVRAVPFDYIDVTENKELLHMNSGTYDNVAKYPWFYVGESDPGALTPLPGYTTFKNTLLQRMQRDPELHAALGTAATQEDPAETP